MTEKKKTTKKTTARVAAAPKVQAPVIEHREDVFPAIEVAEIIGLSDFDFLTIKNKKGITDGTLLSITQMQEYIQKVIKEGR